MAVAAVGEEADHRLVDLNAAGGLRAVGGDRALGALRRDRARSVGDEKTDQDLQRPRLGLARLLAGQSEEQEIRHGPAAESFLAGNPPQAAMLVMLGRDRGADHHAVEPQIPGQRLRRQARDAFAHQRSPRDGGGDRREDGIARGTPAERFEELEEQRFAAAFADGFQHRLGARIVRLVGASQRTARAYSRRP